MKNWFAAASLGVAASLTVSAVADDDHGGRHQGKRVFRAELVSYDEVPSVSSPARGQFYAVLNKEENQLTYWLSFSGLTADVSQSHIHFGQHHTNGGISVWLCEGSLQAPTASTPACGGTRSTPMAVTGVITSAEIIGPAAQGIAATELAELIAAMRAGAAYANVHSTTTLPAPAVAFPGGEIRGQIH
jgi:hypothetical protein